MPVGSFPGLRELNRRTIRGAVNPLDKSTIVSIFPKKIKVIKVTLLPGMWVIEPGSVENPSLLVVGPSSWFKELELNEPLLEIPQSSVQIADSIIKDYCNGIVGCNMGDSMPGLFFVPGEHNITAIRSNYKPLIEKAIASQSTYYRTQIRFADQLWAASNGNPMVINDEMRMAAKILGQMDKDWMKDHVNVGMVRCHACGSMKNPGYPVCATCSAIDPKHPLAMGLKFSDKPDKSEG
ncbi:MAG: hypothetical protein ABWY25_00485 [Paenisporosarcina sp.]